MKCGKSGQRKNMTKTLCFISTTPYLGYVILVSKVQKPALRRKEAGRITALQVTGISVLYNR